MGEIWRPRQLVGAGKREIPTPHIEIFPSDTIVGRVTSTLVGSGLKINVMSYSHPDFGIERTLGLSQELVANDFAVVPHLSAYEIEDAAHLGRITRQFAKMGIDEMVVVKGDGEPKGDYKSAEQLMRDLAIGGVKLKAIGIGGYPEGVSRMTDKQLERSIDRRNHIAHRMGAELRVVTQMCFDHKKILEYAAKIRSMGDDAPSVYVGLPIHRNRGVLYEMASALGVGDSKEVLLEEANSEYSPKDLMERILAEDNDELISGFIIYSFNNISETKELLS